MAKWAANCGRPQYVLYNCRSCHKNCKTRQSVTSRIPVQNIEPWLAFETVSNGDWRFRWNTRLRRTNHWHWAPWCWFQVCFGLPVECRHFCWTGLPYPLNHGLFVAALPCFDQAIWPHDYVRSCSTLTTTEKTTKIGRLKRNMFATLLKSPWLVRFIQTIWPTFSEWGPSYFQIGSILPCK